MTEPKPPSAQPQPPTASLESKEEKGYNKEFFDLQIQFAIKLAQVTGKSFSDALLNHTNLYRRFGLGRELDSNNPVWQEFISKQEGDLVDRVYEFYLRKRDTLEQENRPKRIEFGCFSYDYDSSKRAIKIHFTNKEEKDSPFADVEKRKQELAEMFKHIKKNHPDAEFVSGGSWLFNLEKFNRLFPPEFTQDLKPGGGSLRGMSSWGSVLR